MSHYYKMASFRKRGPRDFSSSAFFAGMAAAHAAAPGTRVFQGDFVVLRRCCGGWLLFHRAIHEVAMPGAADAELVFTDTAMAS